MSYNTIFKYGEKVSIAVASGERIAIKSKGSFAVSEKVSDPNMVDVYGSATAYNNEEYISSTYSSAATLQIENTGAHEVHYVVGIDAQVVDECTSRTNWTVGSLDATGTLTTALCLGGVVTSSTASAVTATLDTGAVTDTNSEFDVGEGFTWSVVNTGATNAFTVTQSTGHTVVGENIVAADSSGLFLTLKTAADTFVTYRLSGT